MSGLAPDAKEKITYHRVDREADLPDWASREKLVRFFHETMVPYEDEPGDIHRALDYAFSDEGGRGGFLYLALHEDRLAGALLMLKTGMGGYVPDNILLFVSIEPEMRNHGIGRRLIEGAVAECEGAVKLHVEYDNPAKRLYERLGFTNKYAEMRLER